MQWPPLTRNLHRLSFAGGKVHLLLGVGDALDLLPELQAQVNDFLIDEVDALVGPATGPAAPVQRPGTAGGTGGQSACGSRPAGAAARPWPAPASKCRPATTEIRAVYQPRFTPRRRGRPSTPLDRAPRTDRRRRPGRLRHRLGAGRTGLAQHAHRPCRCTGDRRLGQSGRPVPRHRQPAGRCTCPLQPRRRAAGAAHGAGRHRRRHGARQRTRPAAAGHARSGRAGAARRAGPAAACPPTTCRHSMRHRPARAAACRCSTRPGSTPAAAGCSRRRWRTGSCSRRAPWPDFAASLQVQSLRDAGRALATARRRRPGHRRGRQRRAGQCRAMPCACWRHRTGRCTRCAARSACTALRPPSLHWHCPSCPWPAPATCCPISTAWRCSAPARSQAMTDAEVRDADHAFNLQRLAQLSPALAGLQPSNCRVGSAGAAWPTTACRWWARCPTRPLSRTSPGERLDQVPRRPGLYVFTRAGFARHQLGRAGRPGAGGTDQWGTGAAGIVVGGCVGPGAFCAAGRTPRPAARLIGRSLSCPRARRAAAPSAAVAGVMRAVVGCAGAGLALGLLLQLLFLLLLLGQLALALFERVVGFGHGPSFRWFATGVIRHPEGYALFARAEAASGELQRLHALRPCPAGRRWRGAWRTGPPSPRRAIG